MQKNWKSCNFWSIGSSCWNWELFNDVRLVQVGRGMLRLTSFWGWLRRSWWDRLSARIIESHNVFCLTSYPDEISHSNCRAFQRLLEVWRKKVALHTSSHLTPIEAWPKVVLLPILVKFDIWTRLIERFPTTYSHWMCAEEKLHLTPVYTLRHLRCDGGTFPPLRRVVDFRARYGLKTARRFVGGPNLEGVRHGWGKIGLHTCSELSKPVRSCSNLFTIHWPCTLVPQCHFFAISKAFILQSYVISC